MEAKPSVRIVTRLAKVGVTKAEVDRHRAAVSTLVADILDAVLCTRSSVGDVGTASTDKVFRVKVVVVGSGGIATSFPAKVWFVTFETEVVRVSVEGRI